MGPGQGDSVSNDKLLTLPEVIQLAREQSLMGLMAVTSSGAVTGIPDPSGQVTPELTLEATVPSLNNSMESVTQPDGSEKFVSTSNMQTSLNMQLNQNIGLTGGRYL